MTRNVPSYLEGAQNDERKNYKKTSNKCGSWRYTNLPLKVNAFVFQFMFNLPF